MRDAGRRATRVLAGTLFALALAAIPAAAQYGGSRVDPPVSGFLQPGDMVRVALWQEPTLSGDFAVDERGIVSLPLLGERQVTRSPAETVKRQIMQEYAQQLRNQPAQVTLLRRVRVLGAVGTPGLYHLDPTKSLGDAIAEAGGVEPDGDPGDVRIQRQGVLYRASLREHAGIPLESGDTVTVERRSWFLRNASLIVGAAISAVTIIVTRR